MSVDDFLAQLEQKLQRLIELRKQEEEEYGRFLTLADQQCNFSLPNELSERLIEIKDALNRSYDIALNAFSVAQKEDRHFWKEIARSTTQYLQPLVKEQREFNATLVHLLNELISSLTESLAQIRQFHNTLILYFQKIIPVMDTKVRELITMQDRLSERLTRRIAEFDVEISGQIRGLRDYSDLIYQELDKKIETLKVDSLEQQQSLDSLQTSVRSIHHLANAWKSARASGKPISVKQDYRYYHFEENFRGSREEVKQKFLAYLKFFQSDLNAPVLDLGCGRGEFLELLKEASVPGMGVDSNPQMVQKCKELGLEVTIGDLLEFLRSQQENSLGGIFCSQVVEHLPPDYLMRLLEAAQARLKPTAPILLETINIGSAFSFLQMYTRDLTHRTPLHPDTLKFLVTGCGFQRPEVLFSAPLPSLDRLRLFQEASDQPQALFNENMAKLNKLLFDYQDYAVLAFK